MMIDITTVTPLEVILTILVCIALYTAIEMIIKNRNRNL